MTAEDRIKAMAEFGFKECQARFLVTVMLHAGVCVPRQYAAFAGTAYGHNVAKFFTRLVQRGYATASDCLDNRAARSITSNITRSIAPSANPTDGIVVPYRLGSRWRSRRRSFGSKPRTAKAARSQP